MRFVRVSTAIVLAVSLQTLIMLTPAHADQPCMDADFCPSPTVSQTGYRYSYDGGDIVGVPVVSGPSSGPAMEYLSIPACYFNRPPSGDGRDPGQDSECASARNSPRCVAGEMLMRVYSRRAGTTDGWRFVGERCLAATTRVPVADVLAGVAERLEARLVAPQFFVQPPDWALVNLPLIVHVTSEGRRTPQADCAHPEGVCFDVTVPVPGRLEAYPTYSWVFDAAGAVGEGRGRAYDGTSPREDPGYYVSHTYTQPSPAETVELTVTWQARFTVPGLSPLQLRDLPKTAQESFRVLEARSQLVAG